MTCPLCNEEEPEPIELDQTAVMELAAAIQRGDCVEAATCLDVLLRDNPAAQEWADQARRSRMATAA
mgnify:CR=1 FL=1